MSAQAVPPELFRGSKPRACKTHLNHAPESSVNHLNAKLNPICHSLVLLGDLTFRVRAS
jgi:hypothetical protein